MADHSARAGTRPLIADAMRRAKQRPTVAGGSRGFYGLDKARRAAMAAEIAGAIRAELAGATSSIPTLLALAADADTYVRRQAYLCVGRIYEEEARLRERIERVLSRLGEHPESLVRQTAVFAWGRVGIVKPGPGLAALARHLGDRDARVRRGIVGALKQLGERRPHQVLAFARRHVADADPWIRAAVIHGAELWGREHPRDVLPLLERLQGDGEAAVRAMVIHVLGQISYKEGCLEAVCGALREWGNRELVRLAAAEIRDVHRRYARFAAKREREVLLFTRPLLAGAPRVRPDRRGGRPGS